ncbi:uncharacterized protein LOC143285056 [Babylonia areolata]|uniref:uncharacterized protein LOC143285056 n=1 Tax=Babylonia areolata TaxID=304850 RepID=UPI003FD16E61
MSGRQEVVIPATRWTPLRRYLLLDALLDGQGGTPRFHRCQEQLPSGQVKQYLLQRSAEARDFNTLSQLRHAHVLGYEGAWLSRDEVLHVLCEPARVFLSVLLGHMAAEGAAPGPQLYPRWLFHIASALEYLHEQNDEDQPMLHRAVQPDNILVTDQCVLKLCAFHSSKRLGGPRAQTGTVLGGGSLLQSPEIRKGQCYNQPVDIWGFGVTAVYIANYTRAGKAGSAEKLLTILRESGQDGATVTLVQNALQDNPGDRPTASALARDLKAHYGATWLQSPPPPRLFPPALVSLTPTPTHPPSLAQPQPRSEGPQGEVLHTARFQVDTETQTSVYRVPGLQNTGTQTSVVCRPHPHPETHPQPRREHHPELQPQPSCELHPQPSCEPHPQPSCELHPQPNREPHPQPSREPHPQPSCEPHPQPNRETHPQPSREPHPQPNREPHPQPSREPHPQPNCELHPQPSREPHPQPSREPHPQPSRELHPQPKREPHPQPNREPHPQPKRELHPELQPQPHVDPPDRTPETVFVRQHAPGLTADVLEEIGRRIKNKHWRGAATGDGPRTGRQRRRSASRGADPDTAGSHHAADGDRGQRGRGQGQRGQRVRGRGELEDGSQAAVSERSDRRRTPRRDRGKEDDPPRDPQPHPHPHPHTHPQAGWDRARARARHVGPRPDLPVETDGGTSGLGDSVHSQELTDF